jgi:hypothetical protein
MAGGLPRDLIREFRRLFAKRREAENGGNDLPTLCSALIKTDFELKLRAASVEAKDIGFAREVRQLFSKISDLESSLQALDELPNRADTLMAGYRELQVIAEPTDPSEPIEPSDAARKREKVSLLAAELAVYLYYCATLQEFFREERFDVQEFKRAESSGALDQLSRARQAFAVSPSLAESTITKFRKSYKMSVS